MPPRAYAVIIAGFCTVSIAYSIRYAYGMLLPEMLPALDISNTQAGTVFAVYFITYTIFTPILGTLSDLYNYRLLLTIFTAILALGALLMATAGGFMQASLIFAIAGLGHAACWAPVAALVQKWVPDNIRGMAMSIVTMGVGLGIFLWSSLLPIIVEAFNWRSGWLALGLCAMGIAVLNGGLVRNPAASPSATISATRKLSYVLSIYRTLLKNRRFWYIAMAYLLVGFNVIIPFTFLTVYARQVLELDYTTATRLVALIALWGIVGQLFLGTLSDRIGRLNILVSASLIMGLGSLGMALGRTIWELYAVVSFYGLGYGAVWPMYAAAASDYFDRQQTGSVVGLWTVYLGIGSIVAPIFGGWLIDQTGVYTSTFLAGSVAGILSALLLLPVARLKA